MDWYWYVLIALVIFLAGVFIGANNPPLKIAKKILDKAQSKLNESSKLSEKG